MGKITLRNNFVKHFICRCLLFWTNTTWRNSHLPQIVCEHNYPQMSVYEAFFICFKKKGRFFSQSGFKLLIKMTSYSKWLIRISLHCNSWKFFFFVSLVANFLPWYDFRMRTSVTIMVSIILISPCTDALHC